MAKGYWIVELDIFDADAYAAYTAAVRPFLAREGGRFVVRGGHFEQVEGEGRKRRVVVEFASYERALAVYRSDEYQALVAMRAVGAISDFAIAEGFDG